MTADSTGSAPAPLSRSFLLADGRGGWTQLSLAGVVARDWHALYAPDPAFGTSLAWVSPGLGLEWEGRKLWLPEDPGDLERAPAEIGLESFHEDPLPRWVYRAGEARVECLLCPQHGEAAAVLRVRAFGVRTGTRLLFRPAFGVSGSSAPGHGSASAPPGFPLLHAGETPHSRTVRRAGESGSLEILHPDATVLRGPAWEGERRVTGYWFRPVELALSLPPGESVREFRVAVEGAPFVEAGKVLEDEKRRLQGLHGLAGNWLPAGDPLARRLEIYRSRSRAGRPVVHARFPELEAPDPAALFRSLPWMTAMGDSELVELLVRHGQELQRSARSLPATLAASAAGPLTPLHWIACAWRCSAGRPVEAELRGELWPAAMACVERVLRGEDPGVTPTRSGLLVPAPDAADEQPGAVELAVLWFNALQACARWAEGLGKADVSRDLRREADRTREGLRAGELAGWFPPRVGAPPAAAAGPVTATDLVLLDSTFALLPEEAERAMLRAVRSTLWTARGLRLSDPGSREDADPAESAVLPSLLGAWARAERRLACDHPAGFTGTLAACRAEVPGLLTERVVGHAPPVLSPDAPHAPWSGMEPRQLERAHLETDVELFSLFLEVR